MECLENFALTVPAWDHSLHEELVKLHQLKCIHKLRTYCLNVIRSNRVELRQISALINDMKFLENLELHFVKGVEDLDDNKFWDTDSLHGLKQFSLWIPSYTKEPTSFFPCHKLAKMQNLETLKIIIPDFDKESLKLSSSKYWAFCSSVSLLHGRPLLLSLPPLPLVSFPNLFFC